MNCDPCQMLRLMPQRRDIPAHLRRHRAGDVRYGWARLTSYECAHCASLWRWYTVDGWTRTERPGKGRGRDVPPLNQRYA